MRRRLLLCLALLSASAIATTSRVSPVAAGCVVQSSSLARGQRSAEVRCLEERLSALGYQRGWVDGFFGTVTVVAVKAAQAALGVPVTGIADSATLAKLGLTPAPCVVPSLSATGVLLVGDSLTAQGVRYGELSSRIEAEHAGSVVDGVSGRFMSGADRPLSGVLALDDVRCWGFDAALVVVSLGTNDMRVWPTSATRDRRPVYRSRIAEVLEAIGPGHQVLWVAPYASGYPNTTAAFRGVLDEFAAAGALKIADFPAWAAARPSMFVDGVHMTAAGYAARTTWLVEQIATTNP